MLVTTVHEKTRSWIWKRARGSIWEFGGVEGNGKQCNYIIILKKVNAKVVYWYLGYLITFSPGVSILQAYLLMFLHYALCLCWVQCPPCYASLFPILVASPVTYFPLFFFFWGLWKSAMVFYTRYNVNPSVNLQQKALRYITCVLEGSRVRLEYELGKGPSETTGRGRKEGMECE